MDIRWICVRLAEVAERLVASSFDGEHGERRFTDPVQLLEALTCNTRRVSSVISQESTAGLRSAGRARLCNVSSSSIWKDVARLASSLEEGVRGRDVRLGLTRGLSLFVIIPGLRGTFCACQVGGCGCRRWL